LLGLRNGMAPETVADRCPSRPIAKDSTEAAERAVARLVDGTPPRGSRDHYRFVLLIQDAPVPLRIRE
jgi:hypothetical protein